MRRLIPHSITPTGGSDLVLRYNDSRKAVIICSSANGKMSIRIGNQLEEVISITIPGNSPPLILTEDLIGDSIKDEFSIAVPVGEPIIVSEVVGA